MGKKSSLKKIQRICKNLPSIEKTIYEYHIVKGDILISEYGVNEMPDGSIIDADKTYKVPMPVITEVNHKRNIKKLYGKGGKMATVLYIDAVIKHFKEA